MFLPNQRGSVARKRTNRKGRDGTKEKRMRALGLEPRTYGLKVLESLCKYFANTRVKRNAQNDAQQKAHHFEGKMSELVPFLQEILTPDQLSELIELLTPAIAKKAKTDHG